ncbi:hypothetical protein [Rhizobium mongolense]|uniref:hypothetical protein n=1 Tax=Rhizobium mongolense TaxID=57676 RepID=UPI001113636E|nr:hypothetical protein [Rhizobium mongolense]
MLPESSCSSKTNAADERDIAVDAGVRENGQHCALRLQKRRSSPFCGFSLAANITDGHRADADSAAKVRRLSEKTSDFPAARGFAMRLAAKFLNLTPDASAFILGP